MRSIQELMNLSGRVGLITGGAGHLGRVICETLAEQGAAIAVLDKAGSGLVASDLAKRYGVPTLAIDLDLADEVARKTVPERVVDALGGLDILVNNAAFLGTSDLTGWAAPFAEQTVETWRKAMEVNLTAVFDLSQAALPHLINRKHGSIMNIASIYGLEGPDWSLYAGTMMGNPAAYAASKGGLIQFSRWLATTAAPSVRVNVISPGGIARGQPEVFRQRYEARTPLRRMACEEDFKGVVAFLSSDASSYVTAQNIVVDGGWTSW
jgi:NAD(P)-dependent dehydrogenase (short-subunit alcohol dehydrogenase family)